ncbi:MAG: hypothetical protein ABWX68_12880 [Arthrobacter sp.]|uniref:hypothetical protein n=1 Tax=Arthrobacter sp. TaxID=1667 RepID=UPI0034889760
MATTTTEARAGVHVGRLNILRIAYLIIVAGLVFFRWAPLVANGPDWPLHEGIVEYMVLAVSLLAFLGLRYPLGMIPLLLFDALWKLAWLGAVAVPKLRAGELGPDLIPVIISCAFAAIVLAVIPWDHVWRQYVLAPGDPWTIRARRRQP